MVKLKIMSSKGLVEVEVNPATSYDYICLRIAEAFGFDVEFNEYDFRLFDMTNKAINRSIVAKDLEEIYLKFIAIPKY